MSWLLLGVTCIAFAGIALVGWRKWIAPWRHIEQLVKQIAGGERPRTFLVDGGTLAQRVGLALESIFRRQQQLNQQITGRESGTQAILGAMQDGLLVVDTRRHITLINGILKDFLKSETGRGGLRYLRRVAMRPWIG